MTQLAKARTPRRSAAEAPSARRRSRAARPKPAAARSRRTRTAFVLSGGASLGALQVGMLRALYERGITADVLVATSVGALNAAFIASRPQTPETTAELARVWRRIERADAFPLSLRTIVGGVAGQRDHLVPARGLRQIVERHVELEDLSDAPVPLSVIAFDVITGAETVLCDGSAPDAIVAACAIPGIFPPVAIGDKLLVDGGVVNNTPIGHAVELGAERIYVLPTQELPYAPAAPPPHRARRSDLRARAARRKSSRGRHRPLPRRCRADRAAGPEHAARPTDRLRPLEPAGRRGTRGQPRGAVALDGRASGAEAPLRRMTASGCPSSAHPAAGESSLLAG
jgi:predicted acylesterase/phospholipase RssA